MEWKRGGGWVNGWLDGQVSEWKDEHMFLEGNLYRRLRPHQHGCHTLTTHSLSLSLCRSISVFLCCSRHHGRLETLYVGQCVFFSPSQAFGMDSDPTQLYDRLKSSQLEHYFAHFTACGIVHLQNLSELTMQEYEAYGIRSAEDRAKLFKLIQNIRLDLAKNKTHANGSERMTQPTPISLSHLLMTPMRPAMKPLPPTFAPTLTSEPMLTLSLATAVPTVMPMPVSTPALTSVSASATVPASAPISSIPRSSPKALAIHANHATVGPKTAGSALLDSKIPTPLPTSVFSDTGFRTTASSGTPLSHLPMPTGSRKLVPPPQTPSTNKSLKSPTSTMASKTLAKSSVPPPSSTSFSSPHLPVPAVAQMPNPSQLTSKSLSLSMSGSGSRSQASLSQLGLGPEPRRAPSNTIVPPAQTKTGLSIYGVPQSKPRSLASSLCCNALLICYSFLLQSFMLNPIQRPRPSRALRARSRSLEIVFECACEKGLCP